MSLSRVIFLTVSVVLLLLGFWYFWIKIQKTLDDMSLMLLSLRIKIFYCWNYGVLFFGWGIIIKKSHPPNWVTLEKEFRIHQDISHLIKMPNILYMLSSMVSHTQQSLSCSFLLVPFLAKHLNMFRSVLTWKYTKEKSSLISFPTASSCLAFKARL